MNKNQEKIAIELIDLLKKKNGQLTIQDIINDIENFHKHRLVIIPELIEQKLIDRIGKSNIYRLTGRGDKFVSFEKLEYENELEIKLAESNIRANELNEKNSKFNKTATIINVIIGLLNAALLIWQISKAV